jgi:hypothetical protein
MRRTITLLATTLVVVVGITSAASAATLYTNAAHTTPVAVGASISASNPAGSYYYIYNAGGSVRDVCVSNFVGLKVTQNSGGVVKAAVTSRALTNCANNWSAGQAGTLQISGSSIVVGSASAWRSTTLTGSLTLGGSTYNENFVSATGNPPVNGVFAQQPTGGASPVSIVLNQAPSIVGPSLNGTVTGNYTLSGSYSLG